MILYIIYIKNAKNSYIIYIYVYIKNAKKKRVNSNPYYNYIYYQKEGNESAHLSTILYCILVCVYVIGSIVYFNSIYCFCFKIYMASKWFKFKLEKYQSKLHSSSTKRRLNYINLSFYVKIYIFFP